MVRNTHKSFGVIAIAFALACQAKPSSPPPPGLAEFEAWTVEARTAFRGGLPRERVAATLGLVHCNSQIGDGFDLERACSSMRPVTVGPHRLNFRADWSISDGDLWHADVDLGGGADPDCRHLRSATEVLRKKNEAVSAVLCRTETGDEVLFMKHDRGIQVGYLSAAFLRRYPRYLARALGEPRS